MKQYVKDLEELKAFANRVRRHVVEMTHRSGASHIGTSFSMTELLTVLYNGVLQVDPANPNRQLRDRFILSKGHGCAAFYATLAECGFFPVERLETFFQNGSTLVGHATHKGIPGVELSTGSLGHGLPVATGMALYAKRNNQPYRVFAILSDGECDEGSIWEAALFAGHHKLDNLTVIVDYNKIQSLDRVEEVLDLEPLAAKWAAFQWSVREIDGHNLGEIDSVLGDVPVATGKPSCIIAHTVKGKGVSFMEDKLLWHYRSPDEDEYGLALSELESPL